MRPVRFVALSEDGHAFVLADEVGRLLALPIDDRINSALQPARPGGSAAASGVAVPDAEASLSPRDIQARIRSGESAEDVARIAGVPVDRVLRYAGTARGVWRGAGAAPPPRRPVPTAAAVT